MTAHLKQKSFPMPLEAAKVKEHWWQRGYSCHRLEDPTSRCRRDFVHSGSEIVTALEGQIKVEIPGRGIPRQVWRPSILCAATPKILSLTRHPEGQFCSSASIEGDNIKYIAGPAAE